MLKLSAECILWGRKSIEREYRLIKGKAFWVSSNCVNSLVCLTLVSGSKILLDNKEPLYFLYKYTYYKIM